MVDVSTVSITESFSFDDSPENRRKSVPTGNAITDAMSPDLPKIGKQLSSLKLFKNVIESHEMEYNPEKYKEVKAFDIESDFNSSYAQSSPTLARVKMPSPDVSPITSEFNSFDNDDEGQFSDFMKVFGQEQNRLNRFISDEEMEQMEEDSDLSYLEDSKSFLNNVREISYDADENLLN